MKEYKTIQISPENEENAIRYYETFGWKLENTREVYNESQEIVGVSENSKVTTYGDGFFGSFMRGFTGKDGKIESQVNVQTRTNVTHFLSMRFSRDTNMKNYQRLNELQIEFDNTNYISYPRGPRKPIALTVIASIAIAIILISLMQLFLGETAKAWEIVVCVVVLLVAVPMIVIPWVIFNKKSKKAIEAEREIDEKNEVIKEQIQNIISEAEMLLNESVVA